MSFASAACPACHTHYDRLPVEQDEDGGYVVLEVKACPACAALLCACCDQFACDGCGLTFCMAHVVIVRDGTDDSPLLCCPGCADVRRPREA